MLVVWIHASDPTRFRQGYRDLADKLLLPGREDHEADVLQLVHAWLSDLRNGPWLMILDNVDDVFFNDEQDGRPLKSFFPQAAHGIILITSRNNMAATNLVGEHGDVVQVEPMGEDEALALLHTRVPFGESSRADAQALVHALEGIPLAITHAAAYIKTRVSTTTISTYLKLFRESEANQVHLLSRKEWKDIRRDHSIRQPVIATWQISFKHIQTTEPSAADLLALMSMYDKQGIPRWLLQQVNTSQLDFNDALAPLLSFSLVRTEIGAQALTMHRLVQLSMRRWLEAESELGRWVKESIQVLSAAFPSGDYATWEQCKVLLPHVKEVVRHATEDREGLEKQAESALRAGWYLLLMGEYTTAESFLQLSLEIREKVLGREHPDTLNSVSKLGTVLSRQGKYDEAEALHRRALEGYEKALGREHPHTLTSVSNLGAVLETHAKYNEAEAMQRRALEGRERALGRENPDTLTSVSNLGWVLESQGKYDEADALHRQALEGYEKVLGREHPDTLNSVSKLGSVLERQGKYNEAEAMHRRALEGYEKVLGREHPDTLNSVSKLGSVFSRQGKYDEAEAMHRRALEGHEKVLGREHPDTLTSVSQVGSVLSRQGKYDEAEAMQRRALEGSEKVLGREHPNTLTSVSKLGWVLESQGQYAEADALHRRALEGYEKVLGREHPDTLNSVSQLGWVLSRQGKYDEAEAMHRRALEGHEKMLGREHPDTLTSVSQLAAVLESQGKFAEAKAFVIENYEAHSVFVFQASVGSGTYIGQNSVRTSQDQTLIAQDETTIMPKRNTIDIPDDSSVASHTTTRRERLGKDYIARFLADDGEMRALCISVLDKLDREQFVDIGRQMLKSFHLGLLEYAKTELEKQSACLLKSQSGRKRICEEIANIVRSEDTQNEEEKRRAVEQLRLAEQRLEMFTKDILDTYSDSNAVQPPKDEDGLPTEYNDVIEFKAQDELESEDDDLPNFARVKEFFQESEPFQVLLNDFRIQLLPYSLRDIIQTAPHDSISLSDQHRNSLSNRVKAFIEDFTMLEWNWWPLEPRMRHLNSNETRLFWHCVSR
jgi:tetratricopeptide (TPR) repeat protein